ncbi:coiled-coil domain-containing protein [Tautonia sociabilis]|uniref:Uncharacterized protein n=1 Tax=Tautonia sociabilis TaxID=2080755 RepID=A0A432MI10_9BACT|nr:hypothetical protein [Tautonia sociabilis]RUL86993.1 hypothetical protein TsocGM_14445 [Tautonia sociabilis]
MADFLSWLVGIAGLFLLVWAIVGSVAAGMERARARLEGPERADEPVDRGPASALRKSVLPLIGLILFGGCVIYQFFGRPGEEGAGADPPAVAGGGEQGVPGEPEELDRFLEQSELETVASIKRAELASAKAKQQQVATLGARVREALAEWDQEFDRWEAEVIGLLGDDSGRALAGQPSYVRRYRAIAAQERPGREEAEGLRSALETLLEPVEDALASPADALIPDEALAGQLEGLLKQAREGRDAYRTPRIQVQTLTTHAKAAGEPAAKTLREAIAEQEAEEAIAATTLIEAEEEKARREREAALAAARREQLESEGRAEVERIKAETEAKRMVGEQEARRIAEEAESVRRRQEQEMEARLAEARREQLRKAFEQQWPGMQPYLTAFTTPGYTQPRRDKFVRTTDYGPVSLGKLRGAGLLERSVESLRRLHFATAANQMNDRERGGFPTMENTFAEAQADLQRIQEFLVTYGEIMVEEGLLTP